MAVTSGLSLRLVGSLGLGLAHEPVGGSLDDLRYKTYRLGRLLDAESEVDHRSFESRVERLDQDAELLRAQIRTLEEVARQAAEEGADIGYASTRHNQELARVELIQLFLRRNALTNDYGQIGLKVLDDRLGVTS